MLSLMHKHTMLDSMPQALWYPIWLSYYVYLSVANYPVPSFMVLVMILVAFSPVLAVFLMEKTGHSRFSSIALHTSVFLYCGWIFLAFSIAV